VVSRNLGDYGTGGPVIETEEVVAETDTLSFAEYLEIRVFHLLLSIFYYEGNFNEAFMYAKERGIKPFDLMRTAQRVLDRAPAGFRRVIEDFVRETREELFETREEILTWAKGRFPQLLSGELGGNLLSKYSMMGRFYVTQDSVDFLEMAIKSALGRALIPSISEELAAVTDYLRCMLLHVPFGETMQRAGTFISTYDIEAWRTVRDERPLSAFRTPAPMTWQTSMDPEMRAVLEQRLATFGENPATLGKFTRTMFAKDLRRMLVSSSHAAPAFPAVASR
jgi:hypothetical protein